MSTSMALSCCEVLSRASAEIGVAILVEVMGAIMDFVGAWLICRIMSLCKRGLSRFSKQVIRRGMRARG